MMGNVRKLVFISHANPEDNEFARWLGLKLAQEGYEIWSDVTKLIGGEKLWANIEDAIRNHTAKFLFILSKHSNDTNRGTINELQLAGDVGKREKIQDYVIPIRIDDLPLHHRNVAIQQINVVDFSVGWAQGLALILEKLRIDSIPCNQSQINASSVSSWWHEHNEGSRILKKEVELYYSNRFRILGLPSNAFIHRIVQDLSINDRKEPTKFPAYRINELVISFATADSLEIKSEKTVSVPLKDLLEGKYFNFQGINIEFRKILSFLLSEAWRFHAISKGMPTYSMANDRCCYYFKQGMLVSTQPSFALPDGFKGRRALVGEAKGLYWHFGISADVLYEPEMLFCIKSHVLFSGDGQTLLDNPKKMHSKRRSACKGWWNQHWRDRMLLSMYFLANSKEKDSLIIPISQELSLEVPLLPVIYESPISYDERELKEGILDVDGEADEDEDDGSQNGRLSE